MNKSKRRFSVKTSALTKHKYRGGKLSKIVINSIIPYIDKLSNYGIKNVVLKILPSNNSECIFVEKVKNFFSIRRSIKLSKGLGRVYVQYRRGGIRIEPSGFMRYIIKMITITDRQIIDIFDDIIMQIQEKYIKNPEYIIDKLDSIAVDLSDTGIYKPKTSEEKTLYDLVLLVLLNHYKLTDDTPKWIKSALDNFRKTQFTENCIELFVKYISNILSNVSENIFLNFKVTFDSVLLRTLLNKKTNKGQISKLLKILEIDINEIISDFAKDYVSPSFLRSMGEILGGFVSGALSEPFEEENENAVCQFVNKTQDKKDIIMNLTMTFGKDPFTQRNFKWHTKEYSEYRFIEYSKNKDFKDSYKSESKYSKVCIPKPTLSLGIISTYRKDTVYEYIAKIDNLCEDTEYYYKISDGNGKYIGKIHSFKTGKKSGDFEFVVLADSQGMTKYDYDVFINVFKDAKNMVPNAQFISHLGDFVDDGNNENYWQWILSSNLWAENVTAPLIGNHEAKRLKKFSNSLISNPILRHFYIEDSLPQGAMPDKIYYSYVYGDCTFIVLDTNDLNSDGELNKAQHKWAIKTAKEAKTKWKILLVHKSPYSNGPHHSDSDVIKVGKQIIDISCEAEIDLVIGGHDHVYVRTPALNKNEECKCRRKTILENDVSYDTFINPCGTIFIVPGTSGVKNYKQSKNITIPIEKMLNVEGPIYSSVKVTKDVIYYASYFYNLKENTSKIIDAFAIEKNSSEIESLDGLNLVKFINNIPKDFPGGCLLKVEKAVNYYKSLDYDEKIKVTNYNKLLFFNKMLKCNQKILKGDIVTVKTRKEFSNAIKNRKIKTIIVSCDEIKFENIFGFKSKYIINRDLCIRGNAKLSFINFVVKNGASLILDDSLCIDNSRKVSSLYFSKNAIELYDSCNLIINGKVSINSSHGIGNKGYAVFVKGINTNIYLNSDSQNYSQRGFLFSNKFDTNVVVNGGGYESGAGKYSFNIKGKIKINKGNISGIKILSGSSGIINGGTIGQNDDLSASIPIECENGSLTITGGKINSRDGISIYGHGEDSKIFIKPDHDGAVVINKEVFYLGDIEYFDKKMLKINLSKELFQKNIRDINLYSISDKDYFKDYFGRAKMICEINSSIENNLYLEKDSSDFAVFLKSRNLGESPSHSILLTNGANGYLFSRIKIL